MKNMGKSQSKQSLECGSDSIMPIIYGLYVFTLTKFQKFKCCIEDNSIF